MKITKIEVMRFNCVNLQDPGGWNPIGCRIHTDEGIYGDGEAALGWGKASEAVLHMMSDYGQVLIGLDPLDHEVIWNKLYRDYYWGQNGGPIIFGAISALDMALWDIKGKYFNVPVYKLLGGKKRDKLRCYASQLHQGWGKLFGEMYTPEQLAETCKAAVEDGYDCVKVDFFTYKSDGSRFYFANDNVQFIDKEKLELIESRIAAVRKAIGPKVDIIIENHAYTDTNSAIQIGRMAEKYDILYFEEPNTAFLPNVEKISNAIKIPIAHGERLYSRWQFAPFLEKGCVSVIQPDLGTCGGITEGKKICDMAYTYDTGVQIHICGSPLLTAASLHLECVIPNFVIHEHHNVNCRDYNIELCVNDYQPQNGYFEIPDLPGYGNEFSPAAISRSDKLVVK
ncbi:mandelate racemase/muconate lactonizing enzyme family protein [Enterocloster citroniae]|uniref:mandelate racemase/muconate lactonizing enzyme family protein n=1 Tax=Enterocloster citroniae TaxID=358743 RepID=UPI001D08776A|nr:mandelate racemase/muconate lactonizing enzyme family protein [Enterocloster citroniae]MCB7067030.1 mandelate racemase/muconate lactonizing enzyme family protein [Enterocloster citroniae]